MNPIIHQRPEPICETLALLYLSENLEVVLRLMGANNSEGKDGLAFYREHEGLHRKYVAAFRAHAVHEESFDFFFRDMCINDYLITILPFLMDKNLPFDAEERSEEALRALLEESYLFIYNSGGYLEPVSQCESSALNAYIEEGSSGDELRAVAKQPALYLAALSRLIRANVPVMEDAWSLVREEAQPFIASSWSSAEEFFSKGIVDQAAAIRHIYPQLSLYTTSFFIGDGYYYGMFNVDTRPEEIRRDEKLLVTDVCKALGDSTRMEILLRLKQRPWYNRELAQELNLTPATIMHHMDILLQNGLAAMTTDRENQKRIYFSLVPERLGKLQSTITHLFE